MKPSDFYLSSRRFFGVLVPGIIWLSAVALLLLRSSIEDILSAIATFNIIEALTLLGLSLLLGMLLQQSAMETTIWLSAKLFKDIKFGGNNYEKKLWERVRHVIKERYPNAEITLGLEKSSESGDVSLYRLYVMCKRSVGSRSPNLLVRLLETQDDAVLFGILPLPVLILAIAVLTRVNDMQHFFKGTSGGWFIGILTVTVVFEVYMFYRFRTIRSHEILLTFEKFLALEDGMVPDNLKRDSDKKET